jgi:hypothetical protein
MVGSAFAWPAKIVRSIQLLERPARLELEVT